jgi:glycosyltransferase involved in cell wall biosynthesis
LKVIHALGWYFPSSSGGTEVYVDALIKGLQRHGVASVVAAASDGPSADYDWDGIPVHRYTVGGATRTEVVRGTVHGAFESFADWLRSQDADIYHQHSFSRGCGLPHLKLARESGFKTVVTVHVPSLLCLRGTMMLDGVRACDGRIDIGRCTECWGASRGIPRSLAKWQGRHPQPSSRAARIVSGSRLETALLTPALVARRAAELIEIADAADTVVAVSRWLHDALAANGIPRRKLVYCGQGIDGPRAASRSAPRPDGPLRVGFLGRWDRIKGIDVLVSAFRRLPASIAAELTVHALPQDADYERSVRALAGGDPRIRFAPPVPRDEVYSTVSGFDVVAVPSVCLETGPLVVLEAFAAGKPVIGSNLGGIAELVVNGRNGVLVPPYDVESWALAIGDLASDRKALQQLRPSPPRSTSEVADAMAELYSALLREAGSRSMANHVR